MNFAYMAVQNTFNPFLPIVLNIRCYSNISHRGTSARCGQIRYSKRAVCLPFSVRPFGIRLAGSANTRGIGRHPSMPSAWIGLRVSNLLASTVSSFTDVTVKSNRTGNIPRRLRGIVSITSLYAPVKPALCASILYSL